MPQPGDFLVTTTKNNELLARLYAAGIRLVTASEFNHAAIYLGGRQFLHSVYPTGVEITSYRKTWSTSAWSSDSFDLTAEQREIIVSEGRRMVGMPYATRRTVLAYALSQDSIRLIDSRVPMESQPGWVKRLVSPVSLVCSQLIAHLYEKAGVSIGGLSSLGLVTPADLRRAIG